LSTTLYSDLATAPADCYRVEGALRDGGMATDYLARNLEHGRSLHALCSA